MNHNKIKNGTMLRLTPSQKMHWMTPFLNRFFQLSGCLLFFCIGGCMVSGAGKSAMKNEAVLYQDMVVWNNEQTPISIRFAGEKKREFRIGETRQIIKMIPRKSRWFGSLGYYNPARQLINRKAIRIVCEEGQQHFFNEEDFLIWFQRKSQFGTGVCNNHGLLLFFSVSPQRNQYNVDLWQVYVKGKPYDPSRFCNTSLHVSEGYDPYKRYQGTFSPNQSVQKEGLYISGRIVDELEQASLPVDAVVLAIKLGRKNRKEEGGVYYEWGEENQWGFICPFTSLKISVDRDERVVYIGIPSDRKWIIQQMAEIEKGAI